MMNFMIRFATTCTTMVELNEYLILYFLRNLYSTFSLHSLLM